MWRYGPNIHRLYKVHNGPLWSSSLKLQEMGLLGLRKQDFVFHNLVFLVCVKNNICRVRCSCNEMSLLKQYVVISVKIRSST